jgi:hypothetical protein
MGPRQIRGGQMSKQELVERFLMSGRPLTSMDAFKRWNITRLADHVFKMRKAVDVQTRLIRHGNTRYAMYWVHVRKVPIGK